MTANTNSIHFIECETMIQGRKWRGFVERDCDRMGWNNTVDDIASGQIDDVRAVYRVTDGRWEDVTEEVATEIAHNLTEEPNHDLQCFIERNCGFEFYNRLEFEHV